MSDHPPVRVAPIAIAAVAAGKHVLCEKPLAATAAEGARWKFAAAGAGAGALDEAVLAAPDRGGVNVPPPPARRA